MTVALAGGVTTNNNATVATTGANLWDIDIARLPCRAKGAATVSAKLHDEAPDNRGTLSSNWMALDVNSTRGVIFGQPAKMQR